MGSLRQAFAHLAGVRLVDIAVLQGAPVLGMIFALGDLGPAHLLPSLAFIAASVLVVAHVFCFNDWADAGKDLASEDKVDHVFARRGATPRGMLRASIVLAVAGLGVGAALSARVAGLLAGVIAASALYSHPATRVKGVPVLSSLLHVAGQMMQFLAGYALFAPLDARGALISAYFGIVFAAGHLNQEARDYDGDLANRIRTNAVAFGRRSTVTASFALFTGSFAYLFSLAASGRVPAPCAYLAVAYPVYVVAFFASVRGGLTFAGLTKLQNAYRAVFASIGAAMCGILVHDLVSR
ncbi:MAG: UbiA family prenyltransferase [Deltaproteobacteria bacterium]|nr:UbiA family prenyltransferase [Deltaproteobacteria bacterium]